jgi:hypothetical protein
MMMTITPITSYSTDREISAHITGKDINGFLFPSPRSCTVHLDAFKIFYLPTDAQQSCFKRILKFTLKQLLHVSVQSPSSGSILFELAKIIVIKIIS